MDVFAAARLGDVAALKGAAILEEREAYPYQVWRAAVQADQPSVLGLCLRHGGPPDGTGEDVPLVEAAGHRAAHCLGLLVRAGADLDRPDAQGRVTPSAALMAGDEAAVGALEMMAKLVAWRGLGWTLLGVGYDAFRLRLGRLPRRRSRVRAGAVRVLPRPGGPGLRVGRGPRRLG